MRWLVRIAFLAVALSLLAACILQRGQPNGGVGAPNDFLGAAVFAATGVGGAVVNRKLTGDCYASCPAGYACDPDGGLCVRRTCMCPADLVCEVAGGETVCVQPHRPREHDLDAGDAEGGVPPGG